MKKLYLIPLMFLAACAGQSANPCLSRVAAAEVTITESYNTTTKLFLSDTISKETAKKALDATDKANALVDKAADYCETDESSAFASITAALSLIAEAKVFLEGN